MPLAYVYVHVDEAKPFRIQAAPYTADRIQIQLSHKVARQHLQQQIKSNRTAYGLLTR